MTLNQRMHWAVKARLTKEVRLIAKVKARGIPDLERCSVELVWFVTDKRTGVHYDATFSERFLERGDQALADAILAQETPDPEEAGTA